MSTTLQMLFSNVEGRNSTISVADADPTITPVDVELVMDSILAKNVFETAGGELVSKVRAQLVTRTVDVLGEY